MLHGIIRTLDRLRFLVGANTADIRTPPSLSGSYSLRMPTALPGSEQALTVTAAGQMQFLPIPTVAVARASFTNANLTGGTYTFNHSIGRQISTIQVFDNSNNMIVPDEITLTNANSAAISLSSYGTLTGTWNIVAIG